MGQPFRDHEIQEAIDHAVSNIVEQMLYRFAEEPDVPRDRALELITECDGDETAAMGLSLEQQLEVIEEGADDHGYGDLEFRLGNLRSDFESYAVMFIHCIAEGLAREMFEELFDFMDEYDLELEQRRDADNFGWHPHRSERDEGSLCTVFEHRNVEGPGNHVDVWEYRLPSGEQLWFEVWIEADGD